MNNKAVIVGDIHPDISVAIDCLSIDVACMYAILLEYRVTVTFTSW